MIKGLKHFWVVGISILALALSLRLFGLGTRMSVFVDEAIYIRWAQVMRADETLRFLPLSDGKQPLFMWLVIPFLKVFSDPLFAGRFVSVLFGIGVIAMAGLVSWLLFRSWRITVTTLLLVAVCPFLVFFDRKALVDSLLGFWGVTVLALGLLFMRSPRLDLSLLMGVALGGAWLTKTPGELFFFLLPTTLLVAGKRRLADKKFLLKAVAGFLVAFAVGFGVYNILRLGPNFHLVGSRNLDYVYSPREVLSHPLTPLVGNLESVVWWLVILLTIPVFILVIIGIILMFSNLPLVALLMVLWAIAPIVFESLFGKVFTARYILFAIPTLLLFASYGFVRLIPKAKALKVLVLIILAAPILWEDYLLVAMPAVAWLPKVERNGYVEEWTAGYGLKEVADYLKSRPRDTKILVGTEGFFGTMPDGLQMYLEGYQNIRVIGLAYPIKDVSVSLTNALGDNEVYLLANASRFKISDPSEKGLNLVSSFDRPARPDGTVETLFFFRVKPVSPR